MKKMRELLDQVNMNNLETVAVGVLPLSFVEFQLNA